MPWEPEWIKDTEEGWICYFCLSWDIRLLLHSDIHTLASLLWLNLTHWLSLQCPAYRKQVMRLPASINIWASVQFSRSVMSNSLRPHGLQHTRPPCPSSIPRVDSSLCPLSWWCHPTISSSPPALNLSQHQGLFQWVNSLHQVAKVLQFQLQHQSFQWTFRTDFL